MMQFGEELQPTGAHGQRDPAVVHVGLGGYAPVSHHAGEEDAEMPDITRERFSYGKLLLLIVTKLFNSSDVILVVCIYRRVVTCKLRRCFNGVSLCFFDLLH